MPDEALQASLQGRPRQAPDFSPLALGHLHTSCLAVRQLVKQYLSAPSSVQLASLATAISEIHHTLQLLDRRGALLVTGELSMLLEAMAEERIEDSDACAHTLVFAGERLADYVAHLQKPGAIDSALPLLPVINNCRACRGEELLSEMLVVASGIDLPDGALLPLPERQEIRLFTQRIKESRQPLMTGLIGWFTDADKLHTSLSELSGVFAGLAQSCDAPTSLQPLVPLFDSAEFICQSVQKGALDNSAALHKLFAQIERMLDGYSKLDINDRDAFAKPASERLFLNLLYYVALSSETSTKAVALRRRFRLDRFIPRGIASDRSQVQFEGVGDRLADSIRDAIELETEAARAWLVEPGKAPDASDAFRHRLTQLEPAIMLLGATESMRQMRSINQSFAQLASTGDAMQTSDNAQTKERIAESLVRLERALDTELSAVRAKKNDAGQTDLESILWACLSEAQLRLLAVEEDLVNLFGTESYDRDKITTASVIEKLTTINSALQILPLPEVSPLLGGIQSFIERHENLPISRSSHRDLATVMVSLGYYLNSVLQPNGAAGQLLLEAEEALLKLDLDGLESSDGTLADFTFESTRQFDQTTVIGRTAAQEGEYDATIVDYAVDTEVESFIEVSIDQMSLISSSLVEFEQAGNANDTVRRESEKNQLIVAYDRLASEATSFKAVELENLASANIRLLESIDVIASQADQNTHTLLEESVAVLPQLINQMQSPTDKVFGLQDLLDRLNNAVVDDMTLAMDVQGILAQSTLADATLLDMTLDDAPDHGPVMTLDNTLEQVFFRECDQHMSTLRKAVDAALGSRQLDNDAQRVSLGVPVNKAGVQVSDIGRSDALPNRDMLRALHTLTGSAQTVDAQGIIDIAQPLQKAALQKQRNGDYFNRTETEYIAELLDVLGARLACMEAEEPFTDDDAAVMSRLQEFVARSEPWIPERKGGLQLNTNVSSIESVFEEEARELLAALRFEALRLPDDEQRDDAIDRIMSCLHTVKGSARMAGQLALADRAHELEDELRLADGVALDSAVQIGLGELQTLMLVDQPMSQPSVDTPAKESSLEDSQPMGLTEAGFENMLSLSTQATVSQTRLGESMQRLREAFKDIESTSARLQRLPHDNASLDSAAVQEMLSDLDSARRMFGDALLDAEAEHTQGSRADTTLHQTLIRAQLVSFAESHTRLQHAAQDAATETGKSIEFELTGGELNIDKSMFRKIMTPLEHIVRNAVVHGIEPGSERMASGKPEHGRITLAAKIDGTDLLITVTDDGAGIDTSAMQKVLQDKSQGEGEVAKVDVARADAVRDILCKPGFTTVSQADQLGGRGIGLTTVKQLLDSLDGALHLSMPEQGGTAFTLRVPQKIRIAQVVLVEHRAQCFAIPVNFIHTVYDEPYDQSGSHLEYNGVDYGWCSLGAVLERKVDAGDAMDNQQLVLINVHDHHLALMVDKVIGYREIIAQPLGAQLSRLQRYLGGAVLSDGKPVLVPDFNRLLSPDKPSPTMPHASTRSSAAGKTALIVEDSITMRIAAEQMLHGFGITPSLARDGAEAIELLTGSLPDVLLVDIDMPRMNGFDFLRHLRVVHPKHTTPVVMISTRDSKADRVQASELGASDYLVKPYTDIQLKAALEKLGVVTA